LGHDQIGGALIVLEISDLPHVLALINVTSIIILAVGYWFIQNGNKSAHRAMMISALTAAALFLVIYVIYHANQGLARFGGTGFVRTLYFAILISHIVLAAVIAVIVPITAVRAFKNLFEQHKKLARWTLPLWLFVSASGIFVYAMAVHAYPYVHP
jgi:putative membrane protein